jgi:hypothetical protein
MLIGDGGSDLEAAEAVDLFLGFGGVIARPRVLAGAPVFIHAPALAPIVALALARRAAPAGHTDVYARGVAAIADEAQVSFKDPEQRAALLRRLTS